MATIKNKKISDFPKSTGPVRISTWKNRVIISAKGETGFVSTPSRKFNAARFSLLRKLFSPTRLFVKAGFAHFKGRPSDRALKLNYRSAFPQRFSSVKLCFPNIVFSEGSLPIPSNLKASALSSNIILFSWSDSFCADASLMVLLYNPELNQAIVNLSLSLCDTHHARLSYAPHWKGSSCHIYAALHGKNDNSPSVYLGLFHLNPSSLSEFDNSSLFFARKNRPYKRHQPEDFSVNGISGKMGPLNFFTKKSGSVIVRANPRRYTPQTLPEQQACHRFKIVSHFLYTMHPFVKIGFNFSNSTTLPHNAAMRANLSRVVGGSWPNYSILFDKVILSDGSLPSPTNVKTSLLLSPREMSLLISLSAPNKIDQILVGLYNPYLDTALIKSFIISQSLTSLLLPLPLSWMHNDSPTSNNNAIFHLYLSSVSQHSSFPKPTFLSSPSLYFPVTPHP